MESPLDRDAVTVRNNVSVTIAITSQNKTLLQLCRLFTPRNLPLFIVDGRGGCHGMRAIQHVIENAPSDWTVLLDEDAFIIDTSRLERLLEWAMRTGAACVGMCDGGVVPIRTGNPNALNPFFNIIDLSRVRAKWHEPDCRAYIGAGHNMREVWPPKHVLTEGVRYQFGDFENYYCFYFWLQAVGLEMQWLTARTHTDGVSTVLNDHTGRPLVLHTWYGRRFGRHRQQTARIVRAARWVAARHKCSG